MNVEKNHRKLILRKEWVTYLYRQVHNSQLSDKQKQDIFHRATTATYTAKQYETIYRSMLNYKSYKLQYIISVV
jgi:hypothetical protein